MIKGINVIETFQIGKFVRSDIKRSYVFVAYPENKEMKLEREGLRGKDIYDLFGKILQLKEKYGFEKAKFEYISRPNTIPQIEKLNEEEVSTLEKLASAPVMR
ncbi:MAG: hypothetical protein QW404_00475 [Candidatus Nanoarchaeia archaeon]